VCRVDVVCCLRWDRFDGDKRYEYQICRALGIYLIIHCVILCLRKNVGYPLSVRPTIVCGTLHAMGTAIGATVLLAVGNHGDIWQRKILPFSISYFLADIIWYCLPHRDITMSLHHLVMIGCHYPIGEDIGAYVAGAGRAEWCIWLSMVGYLSEWTTALLNVRWLLAHTLVHHHLSFTVISLCLLMTYIFRLVLFPYLIVFHIFPRYAEYAQTQQVLTFYIMVLGHLVVLQLSIQWVALILKFGLRKFLIFAPKSIPSDSDSKFDWRRSAFSANTAPRID